MNPISQNNPPLPEKDFFNQNLEHLSKKTLFKRHLIVKDHIGLDRTNFLTLLWEKLKGMCGYGNRTDSRLVECKTLQLIYQGRKWIQTTEDLARVQALAQRVGLTRANQSSNNKGHLALHHLVGAIGRRLHDNSEDVSKEELSTFAKEYTNEFAKLKATPLFSKELSPFLEEICQLQTLFQQTIQDTSNKEEESDTQEGDSGAATTGQDSDTSKEGATPDPHDIPVSKSTDAPIDTDQLLASVVATTTPPPLKERNKDSTLDLIPVAHLTDPKNLGTSNPELTAGPKKPVPASLATQSQGSLDLGPRSVTVERIHTKEPRGWKTAAKVAGFVALVTFGALAAASYGGLFTPQLSGPNVGNVSDVLHSCVEGHTTNESASLLERGITWIKRESVQNDTNLDFPLLFCSPHDAPPPSELKSNVSTSAAKNVIQQQGRPALQPLPSSVVNGTRENNESDPNCTENDSLTLAPTAHQGDTDLSHADSREEQTEVTHIAGPERVQPQDLQRTLTVNLVNPQTHPHQDEVTQEFCPLFTSTDVEARTDGKGVALITSPGKDSVSSTIGLSGSPAVSNQDHKSKSVTEEVIKPNGVVDKQSSDRDIVEESSRLNQMVVGVFASIAAISLGFAFRSRSKKNPEQETHTTTTEHPLEANPTTVIFYQDNPVTAIGIPQVTYDNNWGLAQDLKHRLEKGESKDIGGLLSEAITQGNVMAASWLIERGATLEALEQADLSREAQNIYEWLSLRHSKTALAPENLDHFAVTLGYGYKSANLMVLDQELRAIQLESSQLKVPPIHTHSDFEMQQFLLKAHPEIEEKWIAFLNSFDDELKQRYTQRNVPDAEASQVPIRISEHGVKIIEEIQDIIQNHFTTHTYHTLQIQEWLKANPTQFLIVRSTGKEDTDTNSNAGGNDSIPFVRPDPAEISRAMGKVIASYFGVKSITQRLGAGDRTVFSEERPFIPVLLQVMIGENLGGIGSKDEEIPRSGVIFTSENDKAQGVTLIQAALGNNEGVVSSTVAVDSYYVDDKHNIHSVIRPKTSRFVGVKEEDRVKAREIPNQTRALQREAALPAGVIRDLKRIADAVSTKYGNEQGKRKPMDMEYTVKLDGEKPTIYLLQGRPLKHLNAAANPPSYLQLDACKTLGQDQKMRMQTLLDGQSYVREVKTPNEVLFVDDMKAAYHHCFEGNNAQKIQAIVIRKTAASTSHESVMLRSKGMLVFVVDDPKQYEKARHLIKQSSAGAPLYLDPQRGWLVKGIEEGSIIQGHISYPIPLELTVPFTRMMSRGLKHAQETDSKMKERLLQENKELFQAFNQKIKEGVEKWSGGQRLLFIKDKSHPEGSTILNLLELMATQDATQAKLAFASLVKYLKQNLTASMNSSSGVALSGNMPKFMVLESIVKMGEKEIIPALENHEPQSMERLYPLKFLEALIFQQASSDVVGGFSFGLSARTSKKEAALMKELQKAGVNCDNLSQTQLYLYSLKNKIWNQKIQKQWTLFIKSLYRDELQTLQQFIEQLNRLHMVGPFLNILFKDLPSVKKSRFSFDNISNTLRFGNKISAIQQAIFSDSDMKTHLELHMRRLNGFERQIEQWKKADHVMTNFVGFKASFQQDFEQLTQKYQTATKFEKLALLEWASHAIDIYDRTIKSLKENLEFSNDQDKVRYFAELLEGYFSMMKNVLTLIPHEDETYMMKAHMGGQLYFETYQNFLANGHQYQFGFGYFEQHAGFNSLLEGARNGHGTIEQLAARPEFAVDTLIIGSKADLNFSVHWPDRFEEYFTTFHQNMEKAIQHMRMKEGMTSEILPEFSMSIIEEIRSSFQVEISQIKQENEELKISFNIPLRQHAGLLTLIVNPSHPEKGMKLEGKIFGNDEDMRWDKAAAFISYFGLRDPNCSFADHIPPQIKYNKEKKAESVSFGLQLSQDFSKQSDLLDKLSSIYLILTMQGTSSPRAVNMVDQWVRMMNFENLPEELYAHTLYLNHYILSLFHTKKEWSKVALVAEQSLLSLAKKGFTSYTRCLPVFLNGRKEQQLYETIPGFQDPWDKALDLVRLSFVYLITSAQKDPSIGPVIQRILANEDLRRVFPQQLQYLEIEESIRKALWQHEFKKSLNSTPFEYNSAKNIDAMDANDVLLEHTPFIAMSFPNNPQLFWNMMFTKDAHVLVKLADRSDQPPYWPTLSKQPVQYGELTVTCISETFLGDGINICREFEITRSGTTKKVTQFDYKQWPDFQLPNEDTYEKFLQSVSECHQTTHGKEGPITVHCAAGQGRTGTFIASYELKEKPDIDLLTLINDLRRQRPGRKMVETEEQYVLLNRLQARYRKGKEQELPVPPVSPDRGNSLDLATSRFPALEGPNPLTLRIK